MNSAPGREVLSGALSCVFLPNPLMSLPLLPPFFLPEGEFPLLLRLPLLAALADPGGFALLPLESQGLLGFGAYGGGADGPLGLPAGALGADLPL